MTQASTLMTFRLAGRPQAALRTIRKALAQQGLRAPIELDVAGRIRHELGATVAPCLVLYVDDPALLLEAVIFQRGAALLIPQPVVVTGDNRGTEVLVRSAEYLNGDTPASIRHPVLDLHVRIIRAMESIAEAREAHLAAGPLGR